jgi:hypothetical protein
MTLKTAQNPQRPTTRKQAPASTPPRGGNYVTTGSTAAASLTEGGYVTTPHAGPENRNRAQGHYVTLAARHGDDTAGSYTGGS